jgi:hypothetical protein
LASADWISTIRSDVGAFCPGCLRDFLELADFGEDFPEGLPFGCIEALCGVVEVA